ncbi:MAG: CHAT domain-containing protein [Gemmatimonadota bacterium]
MPILIAALLLLLASPVLAQSWRMEPVRSSVAAVESDSADQLQQRFDQLLKANPSDPTAMLGLATLTRLQYRHHLSDSLYTGLLGASGVTDTIRVLAALGYAEGLLARGDLTHATRAYRQALDLATNLRSIPFITEVRIGLSEALNWSESREEADSLLSLTAPDLRFLPLPLAASLRCHRGGEPTDPGELDELEEARAGLVIAERESDGRLAALCILQIAAAHFRFGTMDSALILSAKAAALQERLHDRLGFALSLQWRGYLLMTNGQFGEAREAFDRAILEGTAVGNRGSVAHAHLNLTAVYLRFGDLLTATNFAVVADSELNAVGDHRALNTLRLLRGDLARAAGDTARARTIYTDVISRSSRYGGYSSVGPYRSLARMALVRGDWAGAEHLLLQAQSIANRTGFEVWARRIQYDFGLLALARNDLPEAERRFTTLRSELRPEEQERGYAATVRMAEVALRLGNLDRATGLMQEAADSLDARRMRLGDRSLRLLAFQRRDDDSDPDLAMATILAGMVAGGRVEAAFSLAERRRARELRERMLRLDVLRGAGNLNVSGGGQTGTSAELIRAIPDSSTAIIEFVTGRGGEPSVAFALSRAGLRAVILPKADSLLPDIERLQVFIQSRQPATALARSLGAAILDPVLALLPSNVQSLVIIPDGPLHHVPFEALIARDGPVITRYAVSLLPSITVGVQLWQRPPSTSPPDILAFGDPEFGTGLPTGSEGAAFRTAFTASGGLGRLRHSGGEVERVGRYAKHATVLRLRQASEAYLRSSDLARYRVIHFATHALVDERSAARTALALAPGNGQDGFVSAADLAGLHLRADLVVLSACRTAGGQVINGEGVQGLTAPLLEAGARATVATRWQVSDDQTMEILDVMYQGLAHGLTAGAALQTAKLDAFHRGVPPAEWAAFVLVGDQSVRISLRQPATAVSWWIGVVALVLGLVGYGLLKVNRRSSERRSPAVARSARTHQT